MTETVKVLESKSEPPIRLVSAVEPNFNPVHEILEGRRE